MSFPDWVIGVLLIIAGSLGNNLGNNLVSLDHSQKREEKIKHSESSRSDSADESGLSLDDCNLVDGDPGPKKKSYRITGTLIFVFGNLFTFASFGFGAQSLLASLESVQFVSNLVFAYYIHKEVVSTRMILATLSIVGGNILVVIFAEHEAEELTSDGMINLYITNQIYWIYLVIAFIVYLITNATYLKYYHSRVVLRKPLLWNHNFVEPFCYACSSAIVGTQAVLNSKCMAMLIKATTDNKKNEFTFYYIYIILATWLLLVSYWLNRLDKGLELFPPLFIIPVMQVFFVFFAIICGGLYFQEFLKFSTTQFIGFIAGVLMILSGVYGLAPTDMVLTIPLDAMDMSCDSPSRSSKEGADSTEGGSKKDGSSDAEKFVVVTVEGKSILMHAIAASAYEAECKTKEEADQQTPPKAPTHAHTHVAHTSTSTVAVITAAIHDRQGYKQIHPMGDGAADAASCPVASKKNRKIVKRKPLEIVDQV